MQNKLHTKTQKRVKLKANLRAKAVMKFISDLSPETIKMVERIYKQSKHHKVRQRAHCILLSFQGFSESPINDNFWSQSQDDAQLD